jgi:hypothetical protein
MSAFTRQSMVFGAKLKLRNLDIKQVHEDKYLQCVSQSALVRSCELVITAFAEPTR